MVSLFFYRGGQRAAVQFDPRRFRRDHRDGAAASGTETACNRRKDIIYDKYRQKNNPADRAFRLPRSLVGFLALEEYLFDTIADNTVILYLWQNQNTVVIGKTQNAWKECHLSALEADGGKLARRPSGGGAVFHDLGNMCYTFIASSGLYCLERQLKVILEAVKALGIEAEFTGRNDITTKDGRKFSGNAFRFVKNTGLQHGTLLLDTEYR